MADKNRFISPKQVAGARAMIGWTQIDLASRAGVGRSTVKEYEAGNITPHPHNLAKIQKAIEGAGVHPLHEDEWGGEGVRFFKGTPE